MAPPAGELREQGSGSAAPLAPAAAAKEQQQDEQGRRESEELNPMSLAALFAQDPECARPANNKDKQASRSMLFAGAQLDDELELKKLQVFVRIRPSVTAGAPRWDAENCIHATSKYSIAIAPPEGSQAYKSGDRGQTYSFSRVFDSDTSQQDYFDSTAAPLVRDLLRNRQHNSVMMAYGITAAGKTYTIEGTREQPGVMPRALGMLFDGLGSHVEPIVARASYYEVYNEQIFDLLDDQGIGPLGQRAALKLKEDTMGRVFVAGLSEVEISSASDALAVLKKGSRQRQRAETGLNYNSSRSHSIFTVTLYQQGQGAQASAGCAQASNEEAEDSGSSGSGEEKLGRISFVDLAGSERAQRTGNVGVRLKESVAINSSLMTLGRCLEALRWNQQHKGSSNLRVVPYRESKVTHLFRDALHGWGQVVLSVNVSPASRDYDETAHVLKYAALATQIGTIQQAEAPRRTIKAVSPAIKKVKRKAVLPPEARGHGGKAKKAKQAAPAAAAAVSGAANGDHQDELAGIPEAAELEVEGYRAQPGDQATSEPAAAGEAVQEQAEEQPWALACAGSGSQAAEQGHDLGDDDANLELDECEFVATPATPLEAEDEMTAALQAQVQQLIAELQKAEERCVLLEAEVREEVADEMAQLLRDMEESYRQRLEAEVAALEKKHGAVEATKRGRGQRGKQAQEDPSAELAAAQEEAASAAAEAEQLQRQVASLAAELDGARHQVAEVQAHAEEQQAEAQQQQAQAEQRAAALELAVAAAQQDSSRVQEQLTAEQHRSAGLTAELATARQQAADVQASFAAEQQRVAGLAAELEAAQQQAADMQASWAAEQQRAAGLEAELAAARQRTADVASELGAAQEQAVQLRLELVGVLEQAAQLAAELEAAREVASSSQQTSEQYEAQLQEAVTQIEANKCMELEMAEEQAERLRKENLALQRRLQAALAALATYGSPLAGPAGLAARMAQAAPEGNGRGAGGTPHDVALARARQAAAADEQAAVAEAAGAAAAKVAAATAVGGSTMPRSRSRFAEEAEAPSAVPKPAGGPPAAPDAVGAAANPQFAAEQQSQQQQRPAPRLRTRLKQVAAAAAAAAAAAEAGCAAMLRRRSCFDEEAEAPGLVVPELATLPPQASAAATQQPAEEQEGQLQPGPRPRGRAKKAVAFADVQPELAPDAAVLPPQAALEQAVAAAPAESKRTRRMTRAAAAAAPSMPMAGDAPQASAGQGTEQLAEPAGKQPVKPVRGRRRTQAAAAAAAVEHAAPAAPAVRAAAEQAVPAAPAAAAAAGAVAAPAQQAVEGSKPAAASQLALTGVAGLATVFEDEDVPLMASVTFEQPLTCAPPAAAAGVGANPAAVAEWPPLQGTKEALPSVPRRRGRAPANKEISLIVGQGAAGSKQQSAPLAAIPEAGTEAGIEAAAGCQQRQAAVAGGAGPRRRKRLLTEQLSVDMRVELGELEDLSLRQHVAQKQAAAAAAAAAAAGAAPEAAGKRSRRKTQFYRM